LVNDHLRFVRGVLFNSGVPPSDLDDAVQKTFLVASNRLEDIVPAAEKSFLFRAAKHTAGHVHRHLALRRRWLQPIGDHDPAHDESPERALTQKRARKILDDILDTLPGDQRDVFILFEFEQLSGPEIAQLLGIPCGTVASRLRRARKRFHEELARIKASWPAEPLLCAGM
jgi:RNA polymerase sigma-70 factor (ECF subfamily)